MLVGSAPISMPRPLFATFVFLLICAASVAAEGKSTPASARVATSDELAMLNDVLHKTANDYYRWAYTERRVVADEKGRVKSDVLLRHDPSKPYAEQWTPLKIDGREPTERDHAKYRRRGEKSAPSGTKLT